MTILGISHLTFLARDLDRTAILFSEGLGAEEVYDSKVKNFSLSREKFFVLGGVWLAFMEGEPTERSYRHVAFHISEDDLSAVEGRLRNLDVEIKPPRPRVDGEGWSLYFYDYDNNLFELHTGTLKQRLHCYSTLSSNPSIERTSTGGPAYAGAPSSAPAGQPVAAAHLER